MNQQNQNQTDDPDVFATLDGQNARLHLGGPGTPGIIAITDGTGTTTAEYRGDQGAVVVGGDGAVAGSVILRDAQGQVAGEVEADGGELTFRSSDGTAALTIEADGTVRTARPIQEGGGQGQGQGQGGN